MPLPPAPTQTADEINLPRLKKPDLKKPPTPQAIASIADDEVEVEIADTISHEEIVQPPHASHIARETINKMKQVAPAKPTLGSPKNKTAHLVFFLLPRTCHPKYFNFFSNTLTSPQTL